MKLSSDPSPGPEGQDTRKPAALDFRLPAPPLRGLVSTYYSLSAKDVGVDEFLHPEWANARFSLGGDWQIQLLGEARNTVPTAALFGPTSRGTRILASPGAAMVGIGLLPLGWARLVGGPARKLADRTGALESVWPEANALHEALLAADTIDARAALIDAALLARLTRLPPPHPLIEDAHRALMSGDIGTVERYALNVGVSVRTLERLCGALFGFGPKTLLRRQRFLRTLDAIMQAPGQPLAAAMGGDYVDQSHFIREFRAFMGMTPSEYLALPRNVMRRAAMERMRVAGQTMQGLQAPAA